MASDLGSDLMLVSSHLCLSTIGHRIFGLSCLIASLRLSSEAGLSAAWPPPDRNGLDFSKAISLETLHVLARRSRAFFTSLNLPQR